MQNFPWIGKGKWSTKVKLRTHLKTLSGTKTSRKELFTFATSKNISKTPNSKPSANGKEQSQVQTRCQERTLPSWIPIQDTILNQIWFQFTAAASWTNIDQWLITAKDARIRKGAEERSMESPWAVPTYSISLKIKTRPERKISALLRVWTQKNWKNTLRVTRRQRKCWQHSAWRLKVFVGWDRFWLGVWTDVW